MIDKSCHSGDKNAIISVHFPDIKGLIIEVKDIL